MQVILIFLEFVRQNCNEKRTNMKKILLLMTLLNMNYLNAEIFFKIKLNTMQINKESTESNSNFDINGFDENGIHKDTGTIYDTQGYDVTGRDSLGFDLSGFDLLGETKIVCPVFNGPYQQGTFKGNVSGDDYYALLNTSVGQWTDTHTTSIYWKNILIGTASGQTLKYSPYTRYTPIYSFIKENYRYYFNEYASEWHSTYTKSFIQYL